MVPPRAAIAVADGEPLIPTSSRTSSAPLVDLVDTVRLLPGAHDGRHRPRAARRDPEATVAVAHKVCRVGEQMRQVEPGNVPTATCRRQVGVIRGRALILNLPGQPKTIKETLDGDSPRRSLLHRPHRRSLHRNGTQDVLRKCLRRSRVKPAPG